MNSKIRVLLIILLSLVVIGILLFLVWQNLVLNNKLTDLKTKTDNANKNVVETESEAEVEKDDVSQDWKIVEESIVEDMPKYSINIIYPQIENHPNANVQSDFNDVVLDYVNGQADDIRNLADKDSAGRPQVTLTYTIFYESDKYLSLRLQGDAYWGGATTTEIVYSINYDFEENSVITFNDMFNNPVSSLNNISNLSITKLNSVFSDDVIEAGASANADNFKNLNFNKDGITIKFDKYQVGSGVMGSPVITINFDELPADSFALDL